MWEKVQLTSNKDKSSFLAWRSIPEESVPQSSVLTTISSFAKCSTFFLCIILIFEIILHILLVVCLFFLTLPIYPSIHSSIQHTFSPKYLKFLFNITPDCFPMIFGSLYKHHLPSQTMYILQFETY